MKTEANTSPYYWLNNYPQEVEYLALVLHKNFRGVAYSLGVTARSLPGNVPDHKVLTEYKRISRAMKVSGPGGGFPQKITLNVT